MPDERYWLQTLGCPKNQVDSDKLAGLLETGGYAPAPSPTAADLVVVNTCAFVEAARQESVEAVLALAEVRRPGARLVVTGCMAERYGDELAAALPEADLVAGFGQPLLAPERPDTGRVRVRLGTARRAAGRRSPIEGPASSFDLLALPRPAASAPWAYVKVAEGCDRHCGFCAIPSFRGPQRSREPHEILAEVASLVGSPAGSGGAGPGAPVQEIVLVAQDLVSYGRDRSAGGPDGGRAAPPPARRSRPSPLASLVASVSAMVRWTRLLYVYPSGLTDELVEAVLATGVPYFDLSLQHVSRPHLARMRRWGDGDRFLERIAAIRRAAPGATFRSSFILGYPGETEDDQAALLEFLEAARLDWAGFFPFSREGGTFADALRSQVPGELAMERLRECTDVQDAITAQRRDELVGSVVEVLVEAPGRARSVHEAPEIDGIVRVSRSVPVGTFVEVVVTESLGTDLVGDPVDDRLLARAGEA